MSLFGKEVIHLSEVDSTNNFAAILLSDQVCQNGTVIMADSQTFGRGQRGNVWQSEKGENLLISIVFIPDNLSVLNQAQLTWATSLSIIETLAKFNIKAQVKWPNDIFIGGKKIAGILIENQIIGENIVSSIIGVGLNVNQADFRVNNATSILNETGIKNSLKKVLQSLCESMDNIFNELNTQRGISLKSLYESNLYQRNETCQYEDQTGVFFGKIIGVKESGQLLVEVNSELVEYGIKEIRYCSK